jgi:DNA-binding MarR family transcriptional regulator
MNSIDRGMSSEEYEELADFRYQIRRFLNFSEDAAQSAGIAAKQHQALLAIKAMPKDERCTVGWLAARMFLQHQSAVGLVDRLEQSELVVRMPCPTDGREVILALTPHGNAILQQLSLAHREELEKTGPTLARALQAIIRRSRSNRDK